MIKESVEDVFEDDESERREGSRRWPLCCRKTSRALDFVNRVGTAAEDIAIALTGKSDHEVRAGLQQSYVNLQRDLAPLLGAEAATQIADVFCRAVLGEKAEREAVEKTMGRLNS